MNPMIDKLTWILIQDRSVLYARSKGKELFYNPGGKRVKGESDAQALKREIKEELNVDLITESIEYMETFSAQASGEPTGVVVVSKCYKAEYVGSLVPSGEIEELAWFTSADMDQTSVAGQMILKYLKEQDLID